jgi:glycosyltransferase involved in cell wall biosynthesis
LKPNISVVIPSYNCSRTIRATVESVLQQTVPPDEILIIDDGSTDDTASVLKSFGSSVRFLQQSNAGSATTRNRLCAQAKGEMVAFIDSDDVWHPTYLSEQLRAFEAVPRAGLFFTGHLDFQGYGDFEWDQIHTGNEPFSPETFSPPEFVRRYYEKTGIFGSPSFCCVRSSALRQCGDEPFKVHGADDSHLFTLIPLFGWSVVYNPRPLAAYRVIPSSLSANRLWIIGRSVMVFESLAKRYSEVDSSSLKREFNRAFALQKRSYAKLLMAAGKTSQARRELTSSMAVSQNPKSLAKSVAVLAQSFLPKLLQPTWPATLR